MLAQQPQAMQLRYLQTLTVIAGDKNSTIVFPLPMDVLGPLLDALRKKWDPDFVRAARVRSPDEIRGRDLSGRTAAASGRCGRPPPPSARPAPAGQRRQQDRADQRQPLPCHVHEDRDDQARPSAA